MAFAGDLSGYAYAGGLTAAPIATSYSSISKIGVPLAAPISIGTPLTYTSGLATPIAAPLAAAPIAAYKSSAVPIVSSYGYGATIASPLAYKAPYAGYGYGSYGSPILAGGYIGSKYY